MLNRMSPLDPQSHATPAIIAAYVNGYTKGRQDFVETVIASLKAAGFSDIKLTATEFADLLQQSSEKCDAIAAPKSLTN